MNYQKLLLVSGLLLSPLTISFASVAEPPNEDPVEDALLEDDLLLEDDGFIEGLDQVNDQSHWSDGFKTTLDHSQTHETASDQDTGILYQRSGVRLEFEGSLTDSLYVKIDSKYSYYWQDDVLALAKQEGFGRNKWQLAWLQYSAGACSIKAGKQNLIWGEVDGTFAVDVVTPFDYREQLLTDYNSIRLSQTMIVNDCFLDQWQSQLFYTPDSRLDQFPTSFGLQTPDTQSEFGGKVKYTGGSADISFMAAELYPNTPSPVLDLTSPSGLNLTAPQFEFYGTSGSWAISRLLLKVDIGYRTDQVLNLLGEQASTLDGAIGFEYSTAGNHNFNGGIWGSKFLSSKDESNNAPVFTLGWSKTYLNDDLSLNLLSNWANKPKFRSATLLAQYKYNDYFTLSSALGVAEVDTDQQIPFALSDSSFTFGLKYEF